MYVTLEPCAHQGRQPPCVDAVLEAGIARVVIASEDPSEKAAGRGPGILRDGGVEVVFAAGAEAAAARLLNQPFRKHARTGLPLVALKLAMSLDGGTATAPGDSPWISGELSRALVHRWRAESDAIAVGIGTVLADDPLLTARTENARQPLRVVFDSQARLPLDSQLLATLDQSPVLVISAPNAPAVAWPPCARPVPRSSLPTDIEAALARPRPPRASPASSSRAAAPSPPPSGRRSARRVPHLRRPGLAGWSRRPSPRDRAPAPGLALCLVRPSGSARTRLITARFREW